MKNTKKWLALLLAFALMLSFVACTGEEEETEMPNTTKETITPTETEDSIPTEPEASESVTTEPTVTEPAPTEPAPTEPAPTEPAPTEPVPTEPTTPKPTPSQPKPEATTPPTSSACTHKVSQKYHFAGDTCLGVENRQVVEPKDCTEEQEVIYQCPKCRKTAIYEVLPARGHNYSEEQLVLYPTAQRAGCYGKKCTYFKCEAYIETVSIPKRAGSYSSIDSRFSVSYADKGAEFYKMDSPRIWIREGRTWGSVPTITYDDDKTTLYITTEDPTGQMVTYDIFIDMTYYDQGRWADINILEDGGYLIGYAGFS